MKHKNKNSLFTLFFRNLKNIDNPNGKDPYKGAFPVFLYILNFLVSSSFISLWHIIKLNRKLIIDIAIDILINKLA